MTIASLRFIKLNRIRLVHVFAIFEQLRERESCSSYDPYQIGHKSMGAQTLGFIINYC